MVEVPDRPLSGAQAIAREICMGKHYLAYVGNDNSPCKPCLDWVVAMLASNNFEVRQASWEKAHAHFCPRGGGFPSPERGRASAFDGDICSTHLRPGDRWMLEFRGCSTIPGIPETMGEPDSTEESP